jgi:glucokinase
LAAAWAAFSRDEGGRLPTLASIAVAGPIECELVRFTNNHWTIRTTTLDDELGVDKSSILINDFAAMAAAVSVLEQDEFAYIGGPDEALKADGLTTVIGAGTGLGVAQLLRRHGHSMVISTEGGHVAFAPVDEFEIALLQRVQAEHGRVSAERVVSGPALSTIRDTIAGIAGAPMVPQDDAVLWAAAIEGTDQYGRLALDRFVMALGSVAGDLALAHGANNVVVTGELSNRIADRLKGPLFNDRFVAKGRFMSRMGEIPIRLVVHHNPGLLGAAVLYQEAHPR